MEKDLKARGGDGEAIVAAYRELYGMHEIGLCTWLAKLFDPDIGGFYCSNSARDNEYVEVNGNRDLALPDLEATNFAIILMQRLGLINDFSEIPDWMREKIVNFTCSLQREEDGHIYHPQWGDRADATKHGRDLTAAAGLCSAFNFKLPYPTANERIAALQKAKGEEREKLLASLPEHLTSKENFIKYLESFDWINSSYYASNTVAAQGPQIIAAGLAEVCAEHLNKYQNPKTGFWSELADMHTGINGFLKITAFYISAGSNVIFFTYGIIIQ